MAGYFRKAQEKQRDRNGETQNCSKVSALNLRFGHTTIFEAARVLNCGKETLSNGTLKAQDMRVWYQQKRLEDEIPISVN